MNNQNPAGEYYRYACHYMEKIQSNDKYIKLIISKKCGYSLMITLYKEQTLEDLYKYVGYELQNNGLNRLYTQKPITEKNLVPRNSTKITKFIKNRELTPVYKVPAPVIYHLWVDDKSINSCVLCNDLD